MTTDEDEAELTRRARAGDKTAFSALVERHQPRARRLAFDMMGGNVDLAQELTQEAVVQAYLSLPHLRDDAKFGAWFCGITLNVCRRALRERASSRMLLPEFPAFAADPLAVLEARERRRLVREAVASLSPENQAAVALFYFDGRSLLEIADALQISLAAVKGRLHKSRRLIRARLAPHFPDALPPRHPHTRRLPMLPVSVAGVYRFEEDGLPSNFFVVLRDESEERALQIYVGQSEAWAIASALEKTTYDRPMTYDFLVNVLTAARMKLDEIRIVTLREETFYAIVQMRRGKKIETLDARPSDAIALALRMNCPIFVAPEIMESSGRAFSPEKPGEMQIGKKRSVPVTPKTVMTLMAASDVAELLIREAIRAGVEEIRIEPEENSTRLRHRTGGEWQEKPKIGKDLHAPLVARFKTLADMEIAPTETPQVGAIPIKLDGRDYTARVTVEPTEWGERVVIKIERV